MGFLDKFLKSKQDAKLEAPAAPEQQCILVYIEGEDFDRMIAASDALEASIKDVDLGEFDGNEIGEGETVLFLYAPDAELLFRHIEPVLRSEESCQGANVVIRWGGPGAPQREVRI